MSFKRSKAWLATLLILPLSAIANDPKPSPIPADSPVAAESTQAGSPSASPSPAASPSGPVAATPQPQEIDESEPVVTLPMIWSSCDACKDPESVTFDPESGFIFVANVAGIPTAKDGV